MLGYTSARNLYGTLTDNQDSANLTVGDTLINEGIRQMLGISEWPFLETQATATTVASQQFYNLPANVSQLISVTITVGTVIYRPKQATSRDQWDFINSVTGVTSNVPSWFYVLDNTVGFWPIPLDATGTITYNYEKLTPDLSVADYTTGSIVSIAAAGTAVVGSGTSWNASMVGSYIRITKSNAANVGDNIWYPISAVGSATTLTLGRPYLGTAISAGSAAYTIANVMVIPERYQLGPIYWAAAEYWRKAGDAGKADRFEQKYRELTDQMKEDLGKKTTDFSIDSGGDTFVPNPNNYIYNITP